ncbi:MAG: rRNA adenine N-6-methyltransferase family protein [Nocardioidaceae bacterium]
MAGRRWGWYQLSPDWAQRVVEDALVRPGQLVIDVGAGDGALTLPLLAAGARVIAIELHDGRAQRLRDRFCDAELRVVQRDLAEFVFPRRPFRVVANPPYALSSLLLRRLLAPSSGLVAADVVLQRGVVAGVLSGRVPGGARVRRRYSVDQGLRLPANAFEPPPSVDSAVLVVRRR